MIFQNVIEGQIFCSDEVMRGGGGKRRRRRSDGCAHAPPMTADPLYGKEDDRI
jgi:hypothetical protein